MAIRLDLSEIKRTPYISSSYTPPRHFHSHDFFEFCFCVSGHSVNIINDVPIPFQNGSCVILRPSDVHAVTEYDEKIYEHIDLYATKEQFKNLCDCAHAGLYDEIMNDPHPLSFSLSNEIFSFLFNQSLLLKEMIANDNNFYQTLYVGMMSTLLSEWVKHKIYLQTYKPDWLKDLLPKFNDVTFVQKNVTQIAAEAGFTLPYFSTQFKKYMGISAIEYLTKKRIHLSKDLLTKENTLRILDISGMLGFENPSTFSKHFLKEFNLTPKEYRKQAHVISY